MARKKKVKGMKTVSRIAIVGTLELNKWKSEELDTISSRLGSLRSDIWNEYGSLKAWGLTEYDLDKIWRPDSSKYEIPAKLWETTLYDVIGDIHLVQASCIETVLKSLGLRYEKFKVVAFEDLTEQFASKKNRSKRTKRNLSSWTKGVVAQALEQVSSRVGCTIISVSAAYTSQVDARHGILMDVRSGDKFTCFDGVVLQSDTNAADNVEARMRDGEITRFMKHTDVKKILLQRTQKFQEQLNKDSEVTKEPSCNIPETTTGTDKPKTLEPKRKHTSRVNQRANLAVDAS